MAVAKGAPDGHEPDAVWRALADPRRRAILALLRDGPRTTTHIIEQFPSMTRFAVMKHIGVLREVGLVRTREEGARRMNSLNVVPLRMVYDELVDGYRDLGAGALADVKQRAERVQESADRTSR